MNKFYVRNLTSTTYWCIEKNEFVNFDVASSFDTKKKAKKSLKKMDEGNSVEFVKVFVK
jgi:hypothetical protein